jgi:hypothetical protein
MYVCGTFVPLTVFVLLAFNNQYKNAVIVLDKNRYKTYFVQPDEQVIYK